MENQHRKISGYRELEQDEIDLINEIKSHGAALNLLCERINYNLIAQGLRQEMLAKADGCAELDRCVAAQPQRWLSIGRTDIQTGLMALTRAIAQPGGF